MVLKYCILYPPVGRQKLALSLIAASFLFSPASLLEHNPIFKPAPIHLFHPAFFCCSGKGEVGPAAPPVAVGRRSCLFAAFCSPVGTTLLISEVGSQPWFWASALPQVGSAGTGFCSSWVSSLHCCCAQSKLGLQASCYWTAGHKPGSPSLRWIA